MVLNRIAPYMRPDSVLLLGPSENGEAILRDQIDDAIYYRQDHFQINSIECAIDFKPRRSYKVL